MLLIFEYTSWYDVAALNGGANSPILVAGNLSLTLSWYDVAALSCGANSPILVAGYLSLTLFF